ncbi:MAG: hypothetical protein WCK34_04800 [Bacteroidota bacterium]
MNWMIYFSGRVKMINEIELKYTRTLTVIMLDHSMMDLLVS